MIFRVITKSKFFLLTALLLASPLLPAQDIFVAPSGNDNGKGTKDEPFASIEKAVQFISKSKNTEDDKTRTIYLREGKYFISNTIEIKENLSNIIISNFQKEKVLLVGGLSLSTSSIEKVKLSATNYLPQREVYKIDLKKNGITNYGKIRNVGFARPLGASWGELFINGKALHLSRWPNNDMILLGKVLDSGSIPRNGDYSKRGAIFEYNAERISSWKNTDKVWVSGYFHHGYADDAVRVAKIDTLNKTITTAQATLYGFNSGAAFRRWYAFNVLEELDESGEFFIDDVEGVLYFMSDEENIKSINFSTLEDPFFNIEDVQNVKIEGINFEYSRGLGIAMSNTKNVTINNCYFSNLGSLGITIGKGIEPFKDYLHEGTGVIKSGIVGSLQQHLYANITLNREGGNNNKITNCHFYQLGAGGVSLGGGNRKTLELGNNIIENCVFHDINRIEKSYRPAIHLTGVGNKILHCEIYNTPSMAILMHGNNHLVEYNYIHDVVLDADDQGAFYYGRDPSERGTIIRYNYFENIPDSFDTSAIYLDDGACGLIVESNVFFNAGKWNVLLGGGSDNVFINNIFIDNQYGIHVDNRLQNWSRSLLAEGGLYERRLNEVNYLQKPYIEQYPELLSYMKQVDLPTNNIMENNVFYKVKHKIAGNKKWLDFKKSNWKTKRNIQFENYEDRDFSLKAESKVYNKIPGFKEIPFSEIGIINN